MSLRYIETVLKKALVRIPCDAVQCFKDHLGKPLVEPKDLIHYMKYRSGFIEPGQDYVEHSIVDEDTGEECALNCIPLMSKVCIRNKLFPSALQNQIK